MKKAEFSEAMNGISDRFIDEAINYKPEKKIIYPFFRKAAVCAAVLTVVIVLSVFVGVRSSRPQILIGSRIVTQEEMPVEDTGRGIALAGENTFVSVRLSLRKFKNASVSVSDGTVSLINDGVVLQEGEFLSTDGDSEVMWIIDLPDTEESYRMVINTKKTETELTFKFEKEKNLWVISKD